MKLEDLMPEQVERAKECTTTEELMAFVQDNGIELTDEQLKAVSGGFYKVEELPCPRGGEHAWEKTGNVRFSKGEYFCIELECSCKKCGAMKWKIV